MKLLRPIPLQNFIQVMKSKTRDFKWKIKPDLYEKYSWIYGYESTNRLFCFPCLHFSILEGGSQVKWRSQEVKILEPSNSSWKLWEKTECCEIWGPMLPWGPKQLLNPLTIKLDTPACKTDWWFKLGELQCCWFITCNLENKKAWMLIMTYNLHLKI